MKRLYFIAIFLCLLCCCNACRKISDDNKDSGSVSYKNFTLRPDFEQNGWAEAALKMTGSVFASCMKDGDRIVTTDNVKLAYAGGEWKANGELRMLEADCVHEILLVYPALDLPEPDMSHIVYTAGKGMFMAGKCEGAQTDFPIEVMPLVGKMEFRVRLGNEYGKSAVIESMVLRGWKNACLNLEKMSLLPIDAGLAEEIEVPLVYNASSAAFEGECFLIPQKILAAKISVTISENGEKKEIGPADLQYWVAAEKAKITQLDFTAGTNYLQPGDIVVSDWLHGDTENGGIYLN